MSAYNRRAHASGPETREPMDRLWTRLCPAAAEEPYKAATAALRKKMTAAWATLAADDRQAINLMPEVNREWLLVWLLRRAPELYHVGAAVCGLARAQDIVDPTNPAAWREDGSGWHGVEAVYDNAQNAEALAKIAGASCLDARRGRGA